MSDQPTEQPAITQPLKDGNAVAVFIGTQSGGGMVPDFHLFNLTVPVGIHPVGSTVGKETLAKYGFSCPSTRYVYRAHDTKHGVMYFPVN